MKYLLSIIIVFSTLLSLGQQRWESLISNGNEYYRATSFTTSDGGLIICAGYNYMCNICKIDVNGQKLWSKLFAKDGGIYSYCIKQNNNGLISLTGYSNNMATIIMLDPCGEPLWCRSYTDPTRYQKTDFHDMVFLENGNVLAVNWGYTHDNFYDIGLVLFNETGDVLKVEPFDLNLKYDIQESVPIELKVYGDFFIISGMCYFSMPQNPGVAVLTPMFIKANRELQEEWLLPFGLYDNITGIAWGVVKFENNNLLGYGNCLNTDYYENNSILMSFDTAGNEISHTWVLNSSFDTIVSNNNAYNMLEVNDSTYICSGKFGDGATYEIPYGLWVMDTLGNVSDFVQYTNTIYEWKSLSKMTNGNYSNTYLTNDRDILTIALNPDLSQAPIDTTTYNYDSLCDNLPIVSDTIYIDNCSIVTGIEDYEANTINNNNTLAVKAYPSPANSNITIECEENGDFMLNCYNMLGKQVFTNASEAESTVLINVSNWQKGMYVAVVSGCDGKRGVVKFVVQHGSK